MDEAVTIGMKIINALKLGAAVGGSFAFARGAYKCFWSKESFKDAKNEFLAGTVGIVVLLMCDKLANWLVGFVG